MVGCTGAGALRNVFCCRRWHGLHKGIIVQTRLKFRNFQEKSQRKIFHFCALLLETKDTKKAAHEYYFSPRIMSAAAASASASVKPPSGGTETVHRTATKIHRHHAKVEANCTFRTSTTKIRRETASVTDRERVIRFDVNDDDETENDEFVQTHRTRVRAEIERTDRRGELAQTVKKAGEDDGRLSKPQRTLLEGKIGGTGEDSARTRHRERGVG